MKKLTLLMSALMLAGATFAHEGKACCKKGGACCKKEAAAKAKAANSTAGTEKQVAPAPTK